MAMRGGARTRFEEAAHHWEDIGAPYETTLARSGLAHACRAEGDEERALMEFRAARVRVRACRRGTRGCGGSAGVG
jgi:hypothetical protein